MKRLAALAAIAALCAGAHLNAFGGDGQPRLLAEVVPIDAASRPRLFGMPADAPTPIVYRLKHQIGSASCGLLSAPKGVATVLPLLEPEGKSDWPSCGGFTEAAAFRWRGEESFVFRLRQRDTREDTADVDFFVVARTSGLIPLDEINALTPPARMSILRAAAWGKSRLQHADDEGAGFKTAATDMIVTDKVYLNVSRHEGRGLCRIAVDLVFRDSGFLPVESRCNAIQAITVLATHEKLYFIVMIQSATGQNEGRIIVSDGDSVRESVELASQFKPEFSNGNILNVKDALRKTLALR